MNFWNLLIILAIISGQLIKIPIGNGGITLLDSAIIAFCLFGLYRLKFHLKKPPQFIIAAGAFILITIVSLIFSPLRLTWGEYLLSFFYTIRFSSYILFSWLIYSDAFPKIKAEISNIFIYSGTGLAVLGILQFIFLPDLSFLSKFGWDPHYFRTVSTFLDPNFSGAFFVLTLMLSLRGVRLWRTTWQSYLFFALVYLALLTTFSRSSYLMFLTGGLSISFLEKSKKLTFKVILLFLILLLGFQLYTQIISKPRNIDREKSASFRISTWQQGWQLFSMHPILGVGFNSYRYAVKQYTLADAQFLQSHGSSSNDSSILFVAATTGIIGLLSYVYFLYSLCINYSNNRYISISATLGLLSHSIFANSLFFPPILFWLLLISINSKK